MRDEYIDKLQDMVNAVVQYITVISEDQRDYEEICLRSALTFIMASMAKAGQTKAKFTPEDLFERIDYIVDCILDESEEAQ